MKEMLIILSIILMSFGASRVHHYIISKNDYSVDQCFKVVKTWEGLVGTKKIIKVYSYRYKYSILKDGKFDGEFIMKKDVFHKIHSLTKCE